MGCMMPRAIDHVDEIHGNWMADAHFKLSQHACDLDGIQEIYGCNMDITTWGCCFLVI
jgi:hypothetical protein